MNYVRVMDTFKIGARGLWNLFESNLFITLVLVVRAITNHADTSFPVLFPRRLYVSSV